MGPIRVGGEKIRKRLHKPMGCCLCGLSFYIKAINVNVSDLRLIEYLAQFTHFKSE